MAAFIDPYILLYSLLRPPMDTHSQDYIEGYQVHSMLGDGGQAKYFSIYVEFTSVAKMKDS